MLQAPLFLVGCVGSIMTSENDMAAIKTKVIYIYCT